VAFAETPVEIQPADHAGVVVDPTLAVLYNLGDPFRRRLVHPAGDHGNIFIFDSRHLVEALRPHEAEPQPDLPFRLKFARVSARTYLKQRLLMARVQSQSPVDPDQFLEDSFEILDDVLADAHDDPMDLHEPLSGTLRRRHQRVEAVKEQLLQHLDRPVSLDELSSTAGTSVFHLCRLFRKHTGDSIYNYAKRLRLRHGLTLLESTDAPLAELALDAGFSHQSHFTEAFRREYGSTPGHLRRQLACSRPTGEFSKRI
jgi:AraC-like DNA-binding protein